MKTLIRLIFAIRLALYGGKWEQGLPWCQVAGLRGQSGYAAKRTRRPKRRRTDRNHSAETAMPATVRAAVTTVEPTEHLHRLGHHQHPKARRDQQEDPRPEP